MCKKCSWLTGQQAAPDVEVKGAVRVVWQKFPFLHIYFLHLWGRKVQLQLFKPILYLFFASDPLCDKPKGVCDQSPALPSQLSLCMTCSLINQQPGCSWTWNDIRSFDPDSRQMHKNNSGITMMPVRPLKRAANRCAIATKGDIRALITNCLLAGPQY